MLINVSLSFAQTKIQPCMLGFSYQDPNSYVSEAEISAAIKQHPPADTQYKFFEHFDIASRRGAPEGLAYELASNITAFYKRKKEIGEGVFDEKAEAYAMQAEAILEQFEAERYLAARK